MQGLENTYWLKQMQLGQQQLDLGRVVIASQYYEKAFTEALWLLRYHLTKNCTEATVTQLVAMCRKSLLAYEHVNEGNVTQLENQYSEVASARSINQPSTAFKALLETTATLWRARPKQAFSA